MSDTDALIADLTDLIAELERAPEIESPEQLAARLAALAMARLELRRLRQPPGLRA